MSNPATIEGEIEAPDVGAVMERVMVSGDLSPLTAAQRSEYYMRVCQSLGLNPLTKPFAYIRLNGKLTLYALRDCADQLRSLRGISIEIVDRKVINGLLSVHVRATDKDGRKDEDFGVVPVPVNKSGAALEGDVGANLIMKAVTKAKRRVTLSICGLGMLDETEVVTIPGAELVNIEGLPAPPQVEPPPERKKSAEAKRDGSVKRFNKLIGDIKKAEGAIECKEIWDSHKELLETLPRAWYENIQEDYAVKMAEFGIEIPIEEQQSSLRMS